MDPVSHRPDRVLKQGTTALNFIHLQLVQLTRDCGNMLHIGLVTIQNFLELENKLEKILHETRATCTSPLKKPVMSDFETVRQIGRGGFAAVDLVAHKNTGQTFAMKKIKRKKVAKDLLDQVLLERDILTFINNPFVVSMFCSFETERHLCMVLEHVGGGDCAKLLEMHGRLPEDLARMYLAETVLALEYIHSYGILHRDVKPSNLLISSTGHIKLTDFGLSKIGPVNMTTDLDHDYIKRAAQEFADEELRGTPPYIAPEIILQLGYGKSMDWWSLGIVQYEFLVGTVPFPGDEVEEIFEKVLKDNITWPDGKDVLPVDAHDLIRRLLDKNSMTRLGTGGVEEVKEHPFFQDVPWNNLLDQFVPLMNDEWSSSSSDEGSSGESFYSEGVIGEGYYDEDSTDDGSSDEGSSDECSSGENFYCEGVYGEGSYDEGSSVDGSSDDGSSDEDSSDGGSFDEGSVYADGPLCEMAAFSSVAFRFKEVYGSPEHLSLSNLPTSSRLHQIKQKPSERLHDKAVEKPTLVQMDPVSEQKRGPFNNVHNIIHLKLEKMKKLVTRRATDNKSHPSDVITIFEFGSRIESFLRSLKS